MVVALQTKPEARCIISGPHFSGDVVMSPRADAVMVRFLSPV